MEEVSEGLWEITHPLRLGGMMEIGHRMTVIRQSNGDLVVHSPVELDESVLSQLEKLGQPRYFIAPNLFHDMYWKDYLKAFPNAEFFVPAGFGVRGHFKTISTSMVDELEVLSVDGMPKLSEYPLYHGPSKSLIVADLIFNLPPTPSWISNACHKLAGIYDQLGPSRLFRLLIQDKAKFRKSLEGILDLDFETIIMGHGQVVTKNAKQRLAEAFQAHQLA